MHASNFKSVAGRLNTDAIGLLGIIFNCIKRLATLRNDALGVSNWLRLLTDVVVDVLSICAAKTMRRIGASSIGCDELQCVDDAFD